MIDNITQLLKMSLALASKNSVLFWPSSNIVVFITEDN